MYKSKNALTEYELEQIDQEITEIENMINSSNSIEQIKMNERLVYLIDLVQNSMNLVKKSKFKLIKGNKE